MVTDNTAGMVKAVKIKTIAGSNKAGALLTASELSILCSVLQVKESLEVATNEVCEMVS